MIRIAAVVVVPVLIPAAVICAFQPKSINRTSDKGDDPMQTTRDTSLTGSLVKDLLADAASEQKIAHDHVVKEIDSLVSKLCEMVDDRVNHLQRPNAVSSAMTLLGHLRAVRAVDVLVKHIGFPYVGHPVNSGQGGIIGGEGGDLHKATEQRHPAVGALISIGEPCVDRVIRELATTDHVVKVAACEAVLQRLAGKRAIRDKLQETLMGLEGPRHAQVENVIKKLEQ
jgi:hypothetical protein